mmetsp:Transcript_25079/g.43914  ORF Transcript_25079/g.43914 Transcript_25079/m.43914 type:complete len:188 (+) Transcript_25079:233-796(+)
MSNSWPGKRSFSGIPERAEQDDGDKKPTAKANTKPDSAATGHDNKGGNFRPGKKPSKGLSQSEGAQDGKSLGAKKNDGDVTPATGCDTSCQSETYAKYDEAAKSETAIEENHRGTNSTFRENRQTLLAQSNSEVESNDEDLKCNSTPGAYAVSPAGEECRRSCPNFMKKTKYNDCCNNSAKPQVVDK